jgi:Restriction endonuclease
MDYQELVGSIESAFEPGAEVIVGEWVEGPDGRRDCDVSIRGTREGKAYFAFVECKDWRRPVGIGEVDALDSKRRDLDADVVALYSNSGFTAPAVQKAKRIRINTFSAVASGDRRSRVRVNMLAYGRLVRPTNLLEQVIEPPGQDLPIPSGLGPADFRFEGESIHNWVMDQLEVLITEHIREFEQSSRMVVQYKFDRALTFDLGGMPFPVIGMQLRLDLSLEWRAKVLEVEADLGRFDAQTGLLWVPADVTMTFRGTDDTGWEPIEEPTEEEKEAGNVGRILLRAYLAAEFIRAIGGAPDLTKHVVGMNLSVL